MKRHTVFGMGLAALLVGGVPAALAAQNDSLISASNTAYGSTSGEFLLLGASARGAALGNAFQAIANDVSALYYNPAGIALMDGPGALVSSYSYVADTKYSWGGLSFPFSGGARAVGLHLGTFGFKDQPEYTAELPDGTGATYSVSETYLGLTYAENFSDRFAAGITVKGVFDQLGEVSGSAFAVDFGTTFHSALNNHPISFSFVIQNLGSNLSYSGDVLNVGVPRDPLQGENPVPNNPAPAIYRTKAFSLPTTFTVAVAYDLISQDNMRWTLLGDFNQPNNTKAGYVFGTELGFPRMGGSNFNGAVRASYSYASANSGQDVAGSQLNEEQSWQGTAVGGGLAYTTETFNLGFDYAWKYMGILGSTNFFTFSIGW
ncbi:MAG TPA: PorV/PorQ family protein [Gemmatimonadales bacterium]|nr:PorV/PorQ family protein [Gemmatimonadales bacterium]